MKSFRAACFGGLALVIGGANAQTLTGAVWYTMNPEGHFSGGYANTYGGDTYSRNLYITENQTVGSGALLNSGNVAGAPTQPAIDISAEGIHNFQMYCNSDLSGATTYWGLNLFFDNDNLHPLIAARNTLDSNGFTEVNRINTPTLNPFTMGVVQEAVGNSALVQTIGTKKISLLDYHSWSVHHYSVDRVDNFSDAGGLGNGTLDHVIEFSLRVESVPEPASLVGLGALVTGLLARRRRRQAAR